LILPVSATIDGCSANFATPAVKQKAGQGKGVGNIEHQTSNSELRTNRANRAASAFEVQSLMFGMGVLPG